EKVAGPAASAWVEANNARGLPAQELLDLVQSEIAK
ncbi:MAG TPA: C4-dicarboxylate ABC transporter substrate-binding protein, partial [Rhodospirillaceae bacterium]|nr:C4-dicarboxylate ABC transporter substrate-binding protein [Rhodospirillaceae bacterium]